MLAAVVCGRWYCWEISFGVFFFFFQAEDGIRDGHVTGVQTCALPIYRRDRGRSRRPRDRTTETTPVIWSRPRRKPSLRITRTATAISRRSSATSSQSSSQDRKSTRLNSSHVAISYAVFCLKKKTHITT